MSPEEREALDFPALSPIELERLAILSEELGEAQQAVGKILRHGFFSHNPFKPEDGQNYQQLERELGHVQAAAFMVCQTCPISQGAINKSASDKTISVRRFIHHDDASSRRLT